MTFVQCDFGMPQVLEISAISAKPSVLSDAKMSLYSCRWLRCGLQTYHLSYCSSRTRGSGQAAMSTVVTQN